MSADLVRLPTAAARPVQQPTGRAARDYRAAFREANPWPGDFAWPVQRAAARRLAERRDVLAGMAQSPELAILLAMLRFMPAERIEAIGISLDPFPGGLESAALNQARAVVNLAAENRRAMERITQLHEDLP